ncbi:hypothetical protein KFK09_007828 [Dendrobium nobile]|uniref:C2 domain-containing protein n=1 Tax=Dendrobium nobile TaxID=94219 RepID=A0A8T3BW91_DENNO|nr:hypothetical protein KFK09_007828 [Dendrobium nobile]
MGFVSSLLGTFGFGIGVSAGVVIGYYLFIYFHSTDVKDPKIRPLVELDSLTLERMLPEIPLWVKNPDFDRVDWLNKFIENMWPYLDKAICKTAKEIAKPIIAENTTKYKIDSVEFQTLTLGSLPPTFQEFQVIDLQVFAIPRITLKPLVPSFPCFAKIFISLMEKDIIKNQVASMYLWPKTLEIPIMDLSSAMKKPVGILHVKVVRAFKLKKKDLLGKSDPYVKLKLTEEKLPSKKTKVKHSNLNPEWNEDFRLVVKDPNSQALELIVYDWEKVGKHDKIGMQVIPLKELTPDEPKTLTLELVKNMDLSETDEKSRGQIVLELLYSPFKEDTLPNEAVDDGGVDKAPEGTPAGGGLLVVSIHEAEDLEGKHHTNPYARIIFKGEERKTKHIKKTRDPRWEEEFQFVCEEPPVNDKLQVEVHSRPSSIGIHSKETLGYVVISLADVITNKRINEKYNLIDSKNGRIQVELQWRPS